MLLSFDNEIFQQSKIKRRSLLDVDLIQLEMCVVSFLLYLVLT